MPKATGVRLHHPTKRDCVVQIPDPVRSIRQVIDGEVKVIGPKVYPIRLDADGDCIVAPGVLDRLSEVCGQLGWFPFVVLNEVKEAPTIYVGDPKHSRQRRVFKFTDGRLHEEPARVEALHVGR